MYCLPPLPPCSQAINQPVEIIECTYSRVGLEQLLGIGAFSLDRILSKEPDFLVRFQGWISKLWLAVNGRGQLDCSLMQGLQGLKPGLECGSKRHTPKLR